MRAFKKRVLGAALATALAATLSMGTALPALAHGTDPSAASSALSLLPVAVVLAAPAAVLSGGAVLTVVAVQASAEGMVWVLESASDGARASVRLAGGAVLSVGTGLAVTALASGWVLSAGSRAVCFIPNQIGASLLYNERVTW